MCSYIYTLEHTHTHSQIDQMATTRRRKKNSIFHLKFFIIIFLLHFFHFFLNFHFIMIIIYGSEPKKLFHMYSYRFDNRSNQMVGIFISPSFHWNEFEWKFFFFNLNFFWFYFFVCLFVFTTYLKIICCGFSFAILPLMQTKRKFIFQIIEYME